MRTFFSLYMSPNVRSVLKRMVCGALIVASALMINIWAIDSQLGAIAAPIRTENVDLPDPGNAIDRVVGEGTVNQVQGKAQETVGDVKRTVGKATGQTEGVADQVQGRAKQGVGRAERAIDDASEAVEDKADKLVDSVKDFFGK
ncbi:MAG: CsbD family protein [Leptolyngbyaceae bacterium]|nr:CsbD family protein [Leptolyngbyaceae bacterium]